MHTIAGQSCFALLHAVKDFVLTILFVRSRKMHAKADFQSISVALCVTGKHQPAQCHAKLTIRLFCCSKLANVWHAYELQNREPGLIVPVVHPGIIGTTLGPQG